MGSHLNWDPMNSVARRTSYLGLVGAAATVNGTAIDATGYGDIVLTANLGTLAGGGTVTIVVQDDTVTGFSDTPATIAGATSGAITATDDVRLVRIRVRGSQHRGFIRASATTVTGSVNFLSCVFELYPKYDELSDGSPDSTLTLQSGTKFDAAV